MSVSRIIKKPSGPHVYPSGFQYIDCTPPDAIRSTVKLAELGICHTSIVNYIELRWSDGTSTCFGSRGAIFETFQLREDEIITQVDVREYNSNPTYICGTLRLKTNFGQDKVFGSTQMGEVYSYPAAEGVDDRIADRMGLLAFQLFSLGSIIYALRPVFAEVPRGTISAIKYEAVADIPGAGRSRQQPLETRYTGLLRSPTITLHVGPDQTIFYAPAATLCLLPFFNAAINGGFEEAALRAIKLPDDHPSTISALIEFLATGAYSFAFRMNPEVASASQCGAEEAAFHVGVYVAAHKYDCQGLATAARRNFRELLKDVKGLELVTVWIAAYEAGMRVHGNWGASNVEPLDETVIKQIKEMIESDDAEVERAIREIPDLGMDLLKIAVTMACKD